VHHPAIVHRADEPLQASIDRVGKFAGPVLVDGTPFDVFENERPLLYDRVGPRDSRKTLEFPEDREFPPHQRGSQKAPRHGILGPVVLENGGTSPVLDERDDGRPESPLVPQDLHFHNLDARSRMVPLKRRAKVPTAIDSGVHCSLFSHVAGQLHGRRSARS